MITRVVMRMTRNITAQTTAATLSPMLVPAILFCTDPSVTKAMIDRIKAGRTQASKKAQNAPQQIRLKMENKREHRDKPLISTSGGTRVVLALGGVLRMGTNAGTQSTSSVSILAKGELSAAFYCSALQCPVLSQQCLCYLSTRQHPLHAWLWFHGTAWGSTYNLIYNFTVGYLQ